MSNDVTSSPTSLADLVALNDEMAALVRAGTPLEAGLLEFGAGMPGKAGALASRLGSRLQAGESLSDLIRDPTLGLPPLWTSLVMSGIRSGRLAHVLESLAATGRRIADTRRIVISSLVYPAVVVAVAYLVLLFLVLYLAPIMASTYASLLRESDPSVNGLVWLGEHAWWLAVPPLLAVGLVAVEFFSGRRGSLGSEGPLTRSVARWWPSLTRSRRDARLAAFTEILALLVRQQTPIGEALRLAGSSTGDPRIAAAAASLAERYDMAEVPSVAEIRQLEFPPLLAFLLATGSHRTELGGALESTAQHYGERSSMAARRAAEILPVFLASFIGGAATLTVALVAFLPLWQLLGQLGRTH